MNKLTARPIQQRRERANGFSGRNLGRNEKHLSAEETFNQVKKNCTYIGGGILGITALGALGGALKYGANFPAKLLKVITDGLGSLAAIVSPVFIVGNEILNFYSRKSSNGKTAKIKEIREVFDTAREGYYRLASASFTGYIIEPFVNPDKFGKSIFHKIATVANIPNLLFSSVMWAGGNFQALIAWGLKTTDQIASSNAKGKQKDFYNKRVEEHQKLYDSLKRQAVIGSISNPTMQGLRQFADCMALFTGQMSPGEFFKKPFLGLSRLFSLFVGLPEYYAKGVDSFVRVVKERENLKAGLPEFIFKPLDKLGKKVDKALYTPVGKKNTAKTFRHVSEKLFHTISAGAMFALFAPLNDESTTNEEAQSAGGATSVLDKTFGWSAKIFTFFFNNLYIFLGRLPQFFIQSVYFGRKMWGEHNGESEKTTNKALYKIRKNICDNFFVNKVSNIAKKAIEYLVPDFYTSEHDQGYRTYEQIQAKYAFEQAKGTDAYKELQKLGEEYKSAEKSKNNALKSKLLRKIDEKINHLIQKVCLPFAINDAIVGNHNLTSAEKQSISEKVAEKFKQKIGFTKEPTKKELPFIGSEFLATNVFKLFDLKTRFNSIDYSSEHHNMTTAYENDEVGISFEYELWPLIGKALKGLQNTSNRFSGVQPEDSEPLFASAA